MNEATPPHFVPVGSSTGSPFEKSDERLAVELKKGPGTVPARYPAGELLNRHRASVLSYARLCTSDVRYAGTLTTDAFTRLFGESVRQVGPRAAWRPGLLVAVCRIAGEWDTDGRREMLHPALRSVPPVPSAFLPPDGRGDARTAAVRLLPGEDRRLMSLAFQRLPEAARCVLWHVEAEAEEVAVPARLLGLSVEDAVRALERARELLREYCVEVHRELAPGDECRRYSRLLDVSLRRGGNSVDPDLRRHLAGCDHCRRSAAQLDQSGARLAVLLAEGVLGWAARQYVAGRPGRRTAGGEQATLRSMAGEAGPDPRSVAHRRTGSLSESGPDQGAGHDSGNEPFGDAPLGSDTGRSPDSGSAGGAGPRHGARSRPGTGPSAGAVPSAGGGAAADAAAVTAPPVAAVTAEPFDGAPPDDRLGSDGDPGRYARPRPAAGSFGGIGGDTGGDSRRAPGGRPEGDAVPGPGADPYAATVVRAGDGSGPGVGSFPGPGAEPGPGVAALPAVPFLGAGAGAGAGAQARGCSRTGPRHALRRPPPPDGGSAGRFPRRRRLALAVLVVGGCVLVPVVLWSGGGSGNAPSSAPGTGRAAEERDNRPGRIGGGGSGPDTLNGRLRNEGSGGCVGVAGDKVTAGAEVVLGTCTSSERQQWSYGSDGLLRNLADEQLCLDSRLPSSVRLMSCGSEETRANARYDFTPEGNLVPLRQPALALAPVSQDEAEGAEGAEGAEETGLVLRTRSDVPAQRWRFDGSVDSLRMDWITSHPDSDRGEPTSAPASAPPSPPSPARTGAPAPRRTPPPAPKPVPSRVSPSPRPAASAPDWACYGHYCWPGGYAGGGRGHRGGLGQGGGYRQGGDYGYVGGSAFGHGHGYGWGPRAGGR